MHTLKMVLLNRNGGIEHVKLEAASKVANAGVVIFCDKHYIFQRLDHDSLEVTFKETRTLKIA